MALPQVTIQLVTYNSLRHLPECLKSVFDQIYRDFQVLVIDNNSQDGTVEYLRKNYPEVAVFQNKKNLGFSRANNQGIKLLHSPYVLFLNVDVILTSDWLEKVMAEAEKAENQNVASFAGKLLRLQVRGEEMEKTEQIDSCGFGVLKNHQVKELGVGQKSGDFVKARPIFGATGALALYRYAALKDSALNFNGGEYFDEDFFLYKEDVDLAWRLQLFGWQSLFLPQAVAYHERTLKEDGHWSGRRLIKQRRAQSVLGRAYSYRNHFFLLLKNEFGQNLRRYFFAIFFYELKKFFYVLFFEWSSLKEIAVVLKLLPKMLKKRKAIMARVKVGPEEIGKWIN